MAPTIGRIVLVEFRGGRPFESSAVHPAIVTAVFSETSINARVFVDGLDVPLLGTSLPRADTADQGYTGPVWSWPPRVGEGGD